MNEENKKFIENFQERVTKYPEYDRIIGEVDDKRNKIIGAIDKCVNFLNDGVLATGTSSLVRTDIRMPLDPNNKWDTENAVITFNHKGLGCLRLGNSSGYNYGTTFSKELKPNMFLKVLGESDTNQAIKNYLVANKSVKLSKRFNDVCTVEPELKILNDLATKYRDTSMSYQFEEPQEIFRPGMSRTKQDPNIHYIKLDRLKFNRMSIYNSTMFTVHLDLTPEEMEELQLTQSRRYGQDDNEISFETSNITTSMFLMQFPDEVTKALDNIQSIVNKDFELAEQTLEEVNTKLAEYSVIMALKETN